MIYKEDWEEWKERYKAWWKGELDEPLIQIIAPRDCFKNIPAWDVWIFMKHYDNIDLVIEEFEKWCSKVKFLSAAYPNLWINFGPGILGAFLGAKVIFTGNTVWFKPIGHFKLMDLINLDTILNDVLNNRWFNIVKNATIKVSEQSRRKFIVGITDIGGVLDVIASLRGTTQLLKDMFTSPKLVEKIIWNIVEIWHWCYEEFYKAIEQEGTSAWMDIWCHKKWYPIQCDIAYMLSPKLFDRFVLPHIKEQCDRLDYVIYHLDGPGQLIHVKKLLDIENLDGIQWVPGAGMVERGYDCGSSKWFSLYRKIQRRGKRLVINVPFNKVRFILRNLSHRGLLIKTSCSTKREIEVLKQYVGANYL